VATSVYCDFLCSPLFFCFTITPGKLKLPPKIVLRFTLANVHWREVSSKSQAKAYSRYLVALVGTNGCNQHMSAVVAAALCSAVSLSGDGVNRWVCIDPELREVCDIQILDRCSHVLDVPFHNGDQAFWKPWSHCSSGDWGRLVIAPVYTAP